MKLHPKALQIIDDVLYHLICAGSIPQNLKLYVSPNSQLASQSSIETSYGELEIAVNGYAPKGYAYIMGNWGHIPKEFAWVSKPKEIQKRREVQ